MARKSGANDGDSRHRARVAAGRRRHRNKLRTTLVAVYRQWQADAQALAEPARRTIFIRGISIGGGIICSPRLYITRIFALRCKRLLLAFSALSFLRIACTHRRFCLGRGRQADRSACW